MTLLRFLLVLVAIALSASTLEAQRRCVKGKPCGNSCIARNKTCRVGAPKPADPSPSKSRTDSTPSSSRPVISAVPMPKDSTAVINPDSALFVGDATRKVFYKRGCTLALQVKEQDLVIFINEEGAKRAGYARSGARGC